MAFQNILFDLDGTLAPLGRGICPEDLQALRRLEARGVRIEEPDLQKLEPFVGPPLNLSFRERYGMNEEETGRAIHYFRESYDRRASMKITSTPACGSFCRCSMSREAASRLRPPSRSRWFTGYWSTSELPGILT